MEKIVFFREKNCEFTKQNCKSANIELVKPTHAQLEEELIKKLVQKAGRIEIAHDKQKCLSYLQKKLETESDHFTGFSKVPNFAKAKKYMTKNIAIDTCQVLVDMSKCFKMTPNFDVPAKRKSELKIAQDLKVLSEKFEKSAKNAEKIQIFNEICFNFMCFLKIHNFSYEEIEEERIKKRNKRRQFLQRQICNIPPSFKQLIFQF